MGDVIVGFCLDQSGSMMYGQQETIKGFNDFLHEQQSAPGNAYMTLVMFEHRPLVRFKAGDMSLVDDLGSGANKFQPGGGTALYDGVDATITEVEGFLAANPNFSGHKIVVILTDGQENSSHNISLDDLNARMRDKRENEDWEFVFMGSGQAAWTEGQKFTAISQATTANYAGNDSSVASYAGVSSSLFAARAGGQSMTRSMVDTMPKFVPPTPTSTPRPVEEEDED